MSGKLIISLEDIADKLEEASEQMDQYLNLVTGEFVFLSDGTYLELDKELAEEINNSRDYVKLPSQYDLHEYDIMENFAEVTKDVHKREELFRALDGKRPFRYFKDTLISTELNEAYYAFWILAFLEIAKEWCEEHDIPYISRNKQEDE